MTKRKCATEKRACIYARVSTLQNQSPQMQLDCLREFAERRGLHVVEEFIDRGHSGAKERRPGLDALLNAARKRSVDVVLTYRFDRVARSTSHLLRILEEFNSLGVEFVSYSENIDSGTPLGKALFTIAACLGEMERALIMERSAEGQRRARARGKHIGRPRLSVSAERVLALKRAGASLREIARAVGVNRTVVRRVLAGEAVA